MSEIPATEIPTTRPPTGHAAAIQPPPRQPSLWSRGQGWRRGRGVVVLALAGVLVASCGGAEDASKTDDFSPPMAEPMPAPGMPSGDIARESEADFGMGGSAPDVVSDGRAVVRSASIELVVDDGARAVEQVSALAAEFDGQVASTFLSRADDGTVSGSLTLRVPAERLDEIVEALDALARAVPFRSIDEYDASLELSDLDARIANLRAFERELLELLTEVRERDGTVEGLVTVSDRLREVRTEIDVIVGRRTQLADRVALSSVHVSIRQARSTTPVVGTWDLPGVVRDALAATLRLGQLAVEGVVWVALTVIPAAAVAFVVVSGVRAIRRRRSDVTGGRDRTGSTGTGGRTGSAPTTGESRG